ncbi:MAG: hypothetical protein AAF363_09380 [Bacteroidota bacterium]
MISHFELTDQEFDNQFTNAELSPDLFNHEAHLRLAWIRIISSGIENTLISVPSDLKNYVSKLGAENKYNHTLTIAAIKAVYHFTLKSNSTDFKSFINEFPRLKDEFKSLIFTHYSTDIFNSQEAKLEYLEPELLAFDV